MSSGKFEDLALAPRGEGIVTFNMDTPSGRRGSHGPDKSKAGDVAWDGDAGKAK